MNWSLDLVKSNQELVAGSLCDNDETIWSRSALIKSQRSRGAPSGEQNRHRTEVCVCVCEKLWSSNHSNSTICHLIFFFSIVYHVLALCTVVTTVTVLKVCVHSFTLPEQYTLTSVVNSERWPNVSSNFIIHFISVTLTHHWRLHYGNLHQLHCGLISTKLWDLDLNTQHTELFRTAENIQIKTQSQVYP